MQPVVNIAAALADPGRVRALMALRTGELCLCHLIALLELAPSTVSRHMAILRQAGLVETRKEGKWVYYGLPGKQGSPAVRRALAWLAETLAEDPSVALDARRIETLRRRDLEQVCACYRPE